MKKVRYAAGAIGALGAVPALGLVTPPAIAATHAPARTGKTVSLVSQIPRTPDAPCDARSAVSSAFDITALIYYSRDIGCIGDVFGTLHNHKNTGWWMRARSYVNGNLTYNRYNKNGVIHGILDYISFSSTPRHTGVSKICEAMIRSTSPSIVKYGPICEGTGF